MTLTTDPRRITPGRSPEGRWEFHAEYGAINLGWHSSNLDAEWAINRYVAAAPVPQVPALLHFPTTQPQAAAILQLLQDGKRARVVELWDGLKDGQRFLLAADVAALLDGGAGLIETRDIFQKLSELADMEHSIWGDTTPRCESCGAASVALLDGVCHTCDPVMGAY